MNLILGAVLGPIGGLLLLGAITLLIVLYRRRKNTFPPERDSKYIHKHTVFHTVYEEITYY